MTCRTFFLSIILVVLFSYTYAFAALQNGLPPFVNVTDYGNTHRQQFPVTGSIPLPRGALNESDLSRLVLLSSDSQQIPIQFAAIGKWPDTSVKWLLLDFQSTQDAGSTAQYKLQIAETKIYDLPRGQLELWLMADRGVRRLDSVAVEWLDQSGNGRHAMVDAENAPEFMANGINGLPVLRGDRRIYMRLRRLVPLRGDCTFVFVSSFLPGGFSLLGDGDDGFIAIDDFGEGGKFQVRFSAGEKGTSAWLNEPYDPGSFSVWTVIREGTRVIIYRDGKVATQNPEYHSDGTTMNLGLLMGMRPFVNNFKGELAEILIFNESLSDAERDFVESYLMEKYDL